MGIGKCYKPDLLFIHLFFENQHRWKVIYFLVTHKSFPSYSLWYNRTFSKELLLIERILPIPMRNSFCVDFKKNLGHMGVGSLCILFSTELSASEQCVAQEIVQYYLLNPPLLNNIMNTNIIFIDKHTYKKLTTYQRLFYIY